MKHDHDIKYYFEKSVETVPGSYCWVVIIVYWWVCLPTPKLAN